MLNNARGHNTVQAWTGTSDLSVDSCGFAVVSQRTSLFSATWTYNIPDTLWIMREDGVEKSPGAYTRATSTNGMLYLTSGAVPGNRSYLHSRRHPKCLPSRSHTFSASVVLPNKDAIGIRDFGLLQESENGIFFRFKDGKLYACILSNSVLTYEELIDTGFTIDFSKGNMYAIQFQWSGIGNIGFFMMNPVNNSMTLVHSINLIGTLDHIYLSTPSLPIGFRCYNTNGTNVELRVGTADITTLGGAPVEQYAAYSYSEILVTGTDMAFFAIRLPDTINGKISSRNIRPIRLTVSSDKKCSIKAFYTRDSSRVTATTWDPTLYGTVESSTSVTFDSTGLVPITGRAIPAGMTETIELPTNLVEFYLCHGDYLVVTATGSILTMSVSLEWGEEI